ncbi:MAG TPA: hypothetical protein VGI45_24610 [Terracidiphilus sp.]|jgi:hypothetical protein
MLLKAATAALFLSLFLQAVGVPSTFRSDLRLIRLVPTQTQLVAGTHGALPSRHFASFLVISRNNRTDLDDFFALTGGDTSRTIGQMLFVAASGQNGTVSEHSLLVSGHFNQEAITRFVENSRRRTEVYRDLPVLVVSPFTREVGTFREVRWLVVLNSQILIFGSPVLVREELDRWIANSPPDSILLDRLARLDPNDDAWCLLPAPSPTGVVQSLFEKLDSRLGTVARRGEPMEYGIHFGRRVEITASSDSPLQSALDWPSGMGADQITGGSFFFSPSDGTGAANTGRVVVKVSQRKYKDWIAEFSNGDLSGNRSVNTKRRPF